MTSQIRSHILLLIL